MLWHFAQWIYDLPFVLLGVVSILFVWRLPSLYKRFKAVRNQHLRSSTVINPSQAATAYERRVLAVDHFFSGLFDIPAAVMFVFIYVLRWHAKEYMTRIKDKKGIEWHATTLKYFIWQIIDLPTIILYLLLAITFYKFKRMNADLEKVSP